MEKNSGRFSRAALQGTPSSLIQIREVVEPTMSFEIVAHVLEVWGPDIQKWLVTHNHFDEEFASLQVKMNEKIMKTQIK